MRSGSRSSRAKNPGSKGRGTASRLHPPWTHQSWSFRQSSGKRQSGSRLYPAPPWRCSSGSKAAREVPSAQAQSNTDQDRVSIYRQIMHGDQVVLRQHFCLSFSPLGPKGGSRQAVPGSRVFALPTGQPLTFPSQTGHSLSCSADGVPAITMTCHVNGSWSCTANCINTQPGAAICDFVLSFAARDAQGVVFSTQLEGSIGGPNSGVSDEAGVPLPNSRHITWPWKASHPPSQPEFSDIATWDRILAANGVFNLIAAWGPGEITPELFEDEVPTS